MQDTSLRIDRFLWIHTTVSVNKNLYLNAKKHLQFSGDDEIVIYATKVSEERLQNALAKLFSTCTQKAVTPTKWHDSEIVQFNKNNHRGSRRVLETTLETTIIYWE